MQKLLAIVFLLISSATFSQELHIIPQPVSVIRQPGKFILSRKTVIATRDEEDRKNAVIFNDFLMQIYGFKLDIDRQESKNYIRLNTKKFIKAPDKDAYTLKVGKDGILIEGDTYAGTFYGLQTLLQLLPTGENLTRPLLEIPFVQISDYPRFGYRGMHLDVCRHFFPISFVKKYIDYLALHKMNTFHWHLTDDQGWRIEIKKYPNLTSTGAYRNGTIIGRYPGTGNDNQRYGGFYSQDEIREVVKYAAARHINVVPEIEMPGHASAAIASYPWLSCFPDLPTTIPSYPSVLSQNSKTKLVQETWGVFDDVFCAGKDSTFEFFQNVLDEVMELFPSSNIHVGGDECPKTNWKKCPRCQQRMKELNLQDEHELQSYFIQRMEKYLNSKGRTLIGWDEILEGGLAPNAIVMSWRGEKGGIEAAKQNHKVIMTPEKPMYFDHAQTRNEDSLVIGGFNPLEAVYEYDPLPKELPLDKTKYILGAQANLWTEYIAYPSKIEYMVFPRMSALSEVLWSSKEKRNWTLFEKKLQVQFKRYQIWNANFSKAYFELKTSILPTKDFKGILWKLETKNDQTHIQFKDLSKKENDKSVTVYSDYTRPILINSSIGYEARLNGDKMNFTNPAIQEFQINKATGKKISIKYVPNPKYPGQPGAFSLVNGVFSKKGLSNPDWLGWIGDDIEATIDLGKKENISTVRMHTLEQNGSWIYLPQYVEVFISADGKKYNAVGRSAEFVNDTLTMGWITVNFPKQSARFIKLVAKNYGLIPDGKPGAGNKAWVFADEIQVE